ncbi:hypothetical protein N665_0184s0011 [Sinapis alba]|nr:hypothetical protein N665_0184s0011 [Sinapis alba]
MDGNKSDKIGARMGIVDTLELSEGRMLVNVNTRQPLKFSRKVELPDGDEVTIKIKYDKLFKHCCICGMLTHEKEYNPSLDIKSRIQPQTERPGVFTRVQLQLDQSQRQPLMKDLRSNSQFTSQSMLPRKDLSTRHHTNLRDGPRERKYEPDSREYRGAHTERIMRHRNDYSRSNQHGGSQAVKGCTSSLSFPTASDQELPSLAGDQIIGALKDMDIEEQQVGGMMECEVQEEDLLGLELKEMEDNMVLPTPLNVLPNDEDKSSRSRKHGNKADLGFDGLFTVEPFGLSRGRGRRCPDNSLLPFKQMVNDCGKKEFPFTGNMLSWVGKRAGGSTVRCKLDRAVGNEDWHEKFPHTSGKYMRL